MAQKKFCQHNGTLMRNIDGRWWESSRVKRRAFKGGEGRRISSGGKYAYREHAAALSAPRRAHATYGRPAVFRLGRA